MVKAAGGDTSSALSSAPPGLLSSSESSQRLAPQPSRSLHPSGNVGEVFTPYDPTPSPMSFRRPSLPSIRGRGGDRRSQNSTPTSSRRPSVAPGPTLTPAPGTAPAVDVAPGRLPFFTPDGECFECDICLMVRHNKRRKDPNDLSIDECYYEDETGRAVEPWNEELLWCRQCRTEKLTPEFATGNQIHGMGICNACAGRVPASTPVTAGSQPDLASSSQGPASLSSTQYSELLSSMGRSSQHHMRHGTSRPGPSTRQRELNEARLTDPDPELDNEFDEDWKDDPALNPADWKDLQNFHAALDKENMQTCGRCHKRWFRLRLDRDGVCAKCITQDHPKKRAAEDPFFFSAANDMDPGAVPDHLPELSPIEEMCIARAHCFVEVRQHRGVQYKYRGHICNFLSNVGKVYDRLPRLPRELDVVVIRPGNHGDVPGIARQFKNEYRVRKEALRVWLNYLVLNHPGYRDVHIDPQRLDAIQDSEDVSNQLLEHFVQAEGDDTAPAEGEDTDDHFAPIPEAAAIPDLAEVDEELAGIRRNLDLESDEVADYEHVYDPADDRGDFEEGLPGRHPSPIPHLSLGTIRATPIDEYNRSAAIFSLAFPTLYPRGQAEFVTPRIREVDLRTYGRHLLLYKDGRFAKHSRFRYVLFNMLMRRQINTKSGFFVRRIRPEHGDLTLDDLKMAFQDNTVESEAIVNSITRFSSTLRGTRPFWYGKLKQLQATVRQLGSPDLFITLSAADYHWDSLMRLMPAELYARFLAADTRERRTRVATEAIRDHPLLVDYHFYQRFALFKKHVLIPKFNVVDSWDRFEWQARGSAHSHGLYWCKGTPNNEMLTITPQEREQFAKYWGVHITATNYEKHPEGIIRDEHSTMSRATAELENTGKFLNTTVNHVQPHRHSNDYCLRQIKGEEVCRFNMPREPTDEPSVKIPEGKQFYRFFPVTNDGMLNPYNRLITMSWLANTDIQPCTGKAAVAEYVGKYVTKPEKASTSYKALAIEALPFVNVERPFKSFVNKLMNKLIGQRDWSAQEVCHHLLDLPLTHSTRQVLNVNLKLPEDQAQVFFHHEGDEVNSQAEGPKKGKSLLQKYMDRPDDLEHVKYLDWCRCFTHDNNPRSRPGPHRVLNFFPRYNSEEQKEDYARAKLMIHHPFRAIDDLLYDQFDETRKATFAEVFSSCIFHEHVADGYDNEDTSFDFGDAPQDDEDDDGRRDALDVDADFAELARRLPDSSGQNVEEADQLGWRNIDDVDWYPRIGHETVDPSFWAQARGTTGDDYDMGDIQGDYDTLEAKQKQTYDTIVNHCQKWLEYRSDPSSGPAPAPLMMQIDGAGGTGKTHVVRMISAKLKSMAQDFSYKDEVLLRGAPTGVAAFNISGRTLHSLFRLPVKSKVYEPLSRENLKYLQNHLANVGYLIIDEKSMVGLRVLFFLDRRLREAFPNRDQDFGGMSIIIMGDFYQLPPVGEHPMYFTKKIRDPDIVQAQRLYQLFNKTITLNVVKRQSGTDRVAESFRKCLEHLRHDQIDINDWKLLSTRVQAQLSEADRVKFKDALRIFSKKESVRVYNHTNLRDLGVPVVNIVASHTGHPKAAETSTEDAGNLQAVLSVAINAKVMLTENIWVTQGLVNGRIGFVRDVVWGAGVTSPRTEPPDVLLVHFPGYTGPCHKEFNGEKLVPIFRSKREFMFRGNQGACTRTQFPIVLSYAITVHKSQGISLDEAVLNITDKEFVPGLTYVAVSRVRSLKGLMFEQGFDFSHFKVKKSETKQMRLEDAILRAKQELDEDDELPLLPPGGSHAYELPLRPSSPRGSGLGSRFMSETFGGEDFGMSGMPAPPSGGNNGGDGNDVVMGSGAGSDGGNGSGNLPVYDDSLMMDSAEADNPYFNCASCDTKRPMNQRFEPYLVCNYCHFNIPADDPSRRRFCLGGQHFAPDMSFQDNVDECDRCASG